MRNSESAEYGYYFTDKSLDDLGRLNFYELQHALYAAWRAFDKTQGDDKIANRQRVLDIYAEFRRRGLTKFKTPGI